MFRKSFRGWLILLVLGPACALALEIGEIQVNSSLNQLFDAKIPLPGLKPEDVEKVSIKLAPQPMFKEFSLERSAQLTKLVFSIEYNPEGDVYVKVVSTQPVREPSLGLLLEFGWPRGKTYREFTVFLDPVKRLAKQSGDRTKTVLNEAPANAAAAPPPAALPAETKSAAAAVPAPASPVVADAAAPAPNAPAEPVKTPTPAPTPAVVADSTPTPAKAPTEISAPTPIAAPTAPTPAPAPAPNPTVAVPTLAAAPAVSSPVPNAPVAAAAEATQAAAPASASSADTSAAPDPNKQYKAGDSYGPVGAGERLWKIALKLSPDPGITPDQMMKALHKANPKAFSKAGVDGLIAGSVLRVPSLREIADFSGSPVARRLAEAKTGPLPAHDAPQANHAPPAKSEDRIELLQVEVDGLKSYPLPPPPSLEPMPVERLALAAGLTPAPSVADPSPVNVKALSPTADDKADQPAVAEKIEIAKKEKGLPSGEISAAEKRLTTSIAGSSVNPTRPVSPLLEPISAAPLLFSATSEVMAAALKIPAFAIPIQIAPESIIAEDRNAPKTHRDTKGSANPPAASDPRKALAFKSVKSVESAVFTAPNEAAIQVSASDPSRGAGEHYGPVTANERLWDIATRVRPDPSISKDAMMRALFMANPQAFAKTGMDQMKVGATLRIPTLAEIVKHTGSKEAKQLLEQQRSLGNGSPERSAPLSTN